MFIGIETPEDAGLAECNKRQNRRRDLVADVRTIQPAGMQVQGGFIVGFDSDTPGVFERQVEFIQKSGIITAMVGLLTALPQTRLHVIPDCGHSPHRDQPEALTQAIQRFTTDPD